MAAKKSDEPTEAKSLTDAKADPATYQTPVTITNDDGTTETDVQQDVPTSENPDVPNTDRPAGTPGGVRDMSLNYSPKSDEDEAEAEARAGVAAADNPDMPQTDRPAGEPGGPRDMSKAYSPS